MFICFTAQGVEKLNVPRYQIQVYLDHRWSTSRWSYKLILHSGFFKVVHIWAQIGRPRWKKVPKTRSRLQCSLERPSTPWLYPLHSLIIIDVFNHFHDPLEVIPRHFRIHRRLHCWHTVTLVPDQPSTLKWANSWKSKNRISIFFFEKCSWHALTCVGQL